MSTMNTVGRPTAPNQVQTKPATLTGGRGLLQNEALIDRKSTRLNSSHRL